MDGQETTIPDREVLACWGAPVRLHSALRTRRYRWRERVGDAARQFRDAGVAAELVRRLQAWGIAFTDREVRLQHH